MLQTHAEPHSFSPLLSLPPSRRQGECNSLPTSLVDAQLRILDHIPSSSLTTPGIGVIYCPHVVRGLYVYIIHENARETEWVHKETETKNVYELYPRISQTLFL